MNPTRSPFFPDFGMARRLPAMSLRKRFKNILRQASFTLSYPRKMLEAMNGEVLLMGKEFISENDV
jgi:hypothetical protein